MNLESKLRSTLRRVDPPPGFAGRVMELCGGQPPRLSGQRRAAVLHRALVAAALIALTIGGWGMHARHELLTAMRIASQKVAHVQQEVNRR